MNEGADTAPGGRLIWLVINLDRSGDRLATMRAHLSGQGIEFTRVPAIDGRTLTLPMPGVDPELYRRSHGRDLRSGEVGCYLSHMRAMETFLASPACCAIILEDDAALNPDAKRLVEMLTAPGAPDDWDLVKLEARHKSIPLKIRPLFGPYCLATMLLRTTGGAAYLLNRRAAEACLANLLPMRVPFDHAYDRTWAMGIRGRAVTPFPASAKDGTNYAPSNIETGDQPLGKSEGIAKLPAMWWRANTEAMRVISAIRGWAWPDRK